MFCCLDYAKRLLAIFEHQIQSEYYDAYWSVYIEGIALDQFSARSQPETASAAESHTWHAV